jgi:hypothetical protein
MQKRAVDKTKHPIMVKIHKVGIEEKPVANIVLMKDQMRCLYTGHKSKMFILTLSTQHSLGFLTAKYRGWWHGSSGRDLSSNPSTSKKRKRHKLERKH